MKSLIKSLCPPILMELYRSLQKSAHNQFSGDYQSWEDARNSCTGYDDEAIFQKVKEASLKVKNGFAVFERDAVLFDEIQYSWPVLSGLLMACDNNSLSVLDFGGAFGSSYHQNKKILQDSGVEKLIWTIVEQEKFVQCGKENFQDKELQFFECIEACCDKQSVNVVLLSSVLPYVENPLEILREISRMDAPYIIIDRTPILVNEETPSRLAKQKVPASIYKASYPAWFFQESELLNIVEHDYEVLAKFAALGGEVNLAEPVAKAEYVGYLLKRRIK
ncbi:methyltransferase, TIGR04325 family [Lentisphaera profundi]|uniref:Methyltransferase, TIGR04325 family n=1 Tax=Lentisphaera profundi TaxID=1658616 RepID=A0ABY7VSW9_9BACT|nr:methyltransferase, TIGR04325 family [Lentisphaera profundi]WDE95967.1 methyltransferase, TIGR04325 family [Lentisphaera profundi]